MTEQQEIPWREMLAVLHRRRSLILQVFAGGLATVLVGVWLQGPTYRASATLMITAARARVAVSPDESTGATVDQVTEQALNGEVALIHSEALIRDVLEPYWNPKKVEKPSLARRIVQLVRLPLEMPGLLYRKMHGIEPGNPFDYLVEASLAKLSISPVGRSNLIDVSFESSNPKWAAEFVNKVIARHIERRAKMSQQLEAKEFYESQRQLLGDTSRAAEVALQEFYAREGMNYMSPEQRKAFRERLAELESELSKSETELTEGTARVAFLTSEIRNYPKQIPTESKVAQNQQYIKPRILDLELQRSELLSKYAPTSVRVKDIERQIAEARRLMESDKETLAETTSAVNPAYQTLEVDLAQTRAQMAAVQARVEALRTQIVEYRTKAAHLDEIASEQERLEQEVTNAKSSLLTYAKKEEEARFSSALDDSSIVNLAIAEPAEVPISPQKSKRTMILGLGAVMSLLAGVGLAFLRDRLDPAVKSAAEAHDVTGLPILAEVRS